MEFIENIVQYNWLTSFSIILLTWTIWKTNGWFVDMIRQVHERLLRMERILEDVSAKISPISLAPVEDDDEDEDGDWEIDEDESIAENPNREEAVLSNIRICNILWLYTDEDGLNLAEASTDAAEGYSVVSFDVDDERDEQALRDLQQAIAYYLENTTLVGFKPSDEDEKPSEGTARPEPTSNDLLSEEGRSLLYPHFPTIASLHELPDPYTPQRFFVNSAAYPPILGIILDPEPSPESTRHEDCSSPSQSESPADSGSDTSYESGGGGNWGGSSSE